MNGVRIVAIAIGATIIAELQYGLGMSWYASVPLTAFSATWLRGTSDGLSQSAAPPPANKTLQITPWKESL